jgi:hypothetical protein
LGYPLGNNLFAKAHRLAYSSIERSKSVDKQHLLQTFIKVKNGLSPIFPRQKWPHFEEIYTLVARELSNPKGSRVKEFNQELLDSLSNLICYVISECGYFPSLDKKYLDIFDMYSAFINKMIMTGSTNIISFNYDILLAMAFDEHSIYPDYGFDCYDVKSGRLFPRGYVKVLQPHGAINFALCTSCNKTYYSIDSFVSRIKNQRVYCPSCNNVLSESALIPPSYDKKPFQKEEFAEQIISMISDAKEIFVLGYSFPPYDYDFRVLFAIGMLNNPNKPKIIIVDKGDFEDLEKRFIFLNSFKCSLSFRGKGFMDYVKSNTR